MAVDLLDVLSLPEAKQELNLSEAIGDYDIALNVYVTAISRRLDEMVGPIVFRTIAGETHDGGCISIQPFLRPVSTITTVTEYWFTTPTVLAAETNTTKTGNDYLYDDRAATIYRRSSGSDALFPEGRRNVAITYVTGRYATTALVDAKFKRAAGIILAHLWRADRGGGTQTFGDLADVPIGFAIPRRAEELLGDELRAPFTG